MCSGAYLSKRAPISAVPRLEKIAVPVEGLLDRRVPHQHLNSLRAEALLNPERRSGVA
jgi:hypothetical protein